MLVRPRKAFRVPGTGQALLTAFLAAGPGLIAFNLLCTSAVFNNNALLARLPYVFLLACQTPPSRPVLRARLGTTSPGHSIFSGASNDRGSPAHL